jgi:N-methylhydantoinase A
MRFWPIWTRSIAPARANSRARSAPALDAKDRRRPAALSREVDLRYDGQQWPVRVALDATFDAAAARQQFEAEHQRLFGHIQPGGKLGITALRVIGRGLLDWTPPKAPSPQASAPSRAKGARSGSIPPPAGATCRSTTAPIWRPAAN